MFPKKSVYEMNVLQRKNTLSSDMWQFTWWWWWCMVTRRWGCDSQLSFLEDAATSHRRYSPRDSGTTSNGFPRCTEAMLLFSYVYLFLWIDVCYLLVRAYDHIKWNFYVAKSVTNTTFLFHIFTDLKYEWSNSSKE